MRRSALIALVISLAAAALFRLPVLDRAPRGLNVDEAANAWNSWCLLHTGADQHGVSWPILDTAGFGQGMTTLLMYVELPFQALGGLTPWAIRLPGALAGIAAVALVFFAARRLFDDRVAFASALLLAVTPGHVQMSRWGHMATLFPLAVALVLVFVAVLASDRRPDRREPRIWQAVLAGAMTGVSLYGYYAIRLWLPLFILAVAIVLWSRLRARAVLVFFITAAITGAPLFGGMIFSSQLRKRAEVTWVWSSTDPVPTRVAKVAERYPAHFGMQYLASRGDPDPAYSTPEGYGVLQRFMLPLLLAGLLTLLWRARESMAARILLVAVVTYPLADLLSEHPTAHALRSAPGVIVLPIVCAVGLIAFHDLLKRWSSAAAAVLMIAVCAWGLASSARYERALFQQQDRELAKFYPYAADLMQASEWLRPRLDTFDAVFVTGRGVPHPYIHTLVWLRYPPSQWFSDTKTFRQGPLPGGAYLHEDVCYRYGKMNFFFEDTGLEPLEALRQNGRDDRVLLVIRPGELGWLSLPPPALTISDPEGTPVLECIAVTM